MQVQPITNQPKFNGKLVIDNSVRSNVNELLKQHQLIPKFKEISCLVQDKPYDMFIFRNLENPDFYYIAANKTEQQAKEIKEYTVKVRSDIMLASIVDAAKDAIEMYEKFISKSIKG